MSTHHHGFPLGVFVVCALLLVNAPLASPLEVLSSGWPRTGTDTLKNALDILGYKSYHFHEIMENSRIDHMRKWVVHFENNCTDKAGLKAMFAEYGYTAGADFPVSACWKEIFSAYPNAKVIHMERESSEVWWESSSSTVWSVARRFPFYILLKVIPIFRESVPMSYAMYNKVFRDAGVRYTKKEMDEIAAGYPEAHRAKWIAAYESSNARVHKTIPAEQLHVHKHTDGWPKLCEFLGKPVPDVPYPHSNKRFSYHFLTCVILPAIYLGGPLVLLVVVAVVVWKSVHFISPEETKAKKN